MSKVEGNEYPSPGLIRSVSANFSGEKTVVIMVGLPYMGKSFVARKLYRFFSWLGFNAKIFNVADRIQNEIDSSWTNDHELRKKYSCKVLYELTNYLKNEGGNLGIYDATNCSKDRRKLVIEILKSSLKNEEYHVVWVESSCGDERLGQIRQKKFRKRGQSAEEIAMEKEKMKYYESKYEPFDEDSELYIKIYEFQKLVSNKIEGYIPAKMLYFLSNVKIEPKPLFFTRHGESEYNVLDKVGGDSPLSAYGRKYAGELYGFMKTQPEFDEKTKIYCSTLKRTIETIKISGFNKQKRPPIEWRALSEIEVGICDGMSYKEIEEKMPEEYEKRKIDKLNYRYPQGESYSDLIMRLEPIILELERSKNPVLVVCHRAVLRCLYGYFCGMEKTKIPRIDMPLHTVIKLEPFAFGCKETRFCFHPGESKIDEKKILHAN